MKIDIAEDYNKFYQDNPDIWGSPQDVDFVIKNILQDRYKRRYSLIDLGCGQGRTISVIDAPNPNVVGIDWSEEAIKLAKKRNQKGIFLVGDIRNVDYGDEVFDVVLSVGTHEHLQRIDFNEPYRLLRNDGLFLCVLPIHTEHIGWGSVGVQWEWKLPRGEWTRHIEGDGFKVENKLRHHHLFICTKE